MQKFSRFKKRVRRFYKSLDDHQRKVFNTITISFLVLVLGGLMLFFTKDNVPKDTGHEAKLTCRDSDELNIHTKGAVTYADAKGGHVDEDYCASDGAVFEMTCHKDSFWSPSSVPEKKTVPCPKGCVNGACQK